LWGLTAGILQTLHEGKPGGQHEQLHAVGDTVGDACFVNVMDAAAPVAVEPHSVVNIPTNEKVYMRTTIGRLLFNQVVWSSFAGGAHHGGRASPAP
jgi:hypothetical protein